MTFRPAEPGDRVVAALWAGTSLAVLAAAIVLKDRAIIAECAFKSMVHRPCPTCGLTRAFHLLVAGDWAGALAMNPLGVAAGLMVVLMGLGAPLWVMLRAPVPDRLTGLPLPARVSALLLFVANWTYLVAAGV